MNLDVSSLPGLIVIALAVARAWRFAAVDDMPALIRLRAWVVGESTLIKGAVKHYRRPTLHHLIACPWCLGSYLSLGAFALAHFSPGVAFWILGPLAVSEVVGLIVRNLDYPED